MRLGLQVENNSGVPQHDTVLLTVESSDLLTKFESGVIMLKSVSVESSACAVVASEHLLTLVAPGTGVASRSLERSKVC